MQLNKVKFKPFKQLGKNFAHPHFSGFDFIIIEDALKNVDHLSLDHHFSNLFADDGNEPATCDFGNSGLVDFAKLQNLCFESGKKRLAVGVNFEEKLQNFCEGFVGRRVEIVETLKGHLKDFIKIRKREVFLFF